MTLSVALRHQLSGFTLDVAFEAPAGVTALFGRSGSGKTTVVNAVAGLLRPDRGGSRWTARCCWTPTRAGSTCRRIAAAWAMSFRTGGCSRI
jgi:ABC-type sulfate/molybdate transport systems ATPase subunit